MVAVRRGCDTLLVIAGVLGLVGGLAGRSRAEEFLVVERPAKLRIFDRYQQRLSVDELSQLLPYTPFRILAADETMGDGFTVCMKVEARGTLYYLQKDELGALIGVKEAGSTRRIRNAVLLYDSVEVVSRDGVDLLHPGNGSRTPLASGTVLARIFSAEGRTYVYVLGLQRYGWVSTQQPADNRRWRKITPHVPSSSSALGRVLPAIENRVGEVNEKLRRLFEHLNARDGLRLTAPQWRVRSSETAILCTLESSFPADVFQESSRLLARKLEGALLGTNLRVQATPGSIRVW